MTEYIVRSWKEAFTLDVKEGDEVKIDSGKWPNLMYWFNGEWYEPEEFEALECEGKENAKQYADGTFKLMRGVVIEDGGTKIEPTNITWTIPQHYPRHTFEYVERGLKRKMSYPSQAIYKPRSK